MSEDSDSSYNVFTHKENKSNIERVIDNNMVETVDPDDNSSSSTSMQILESESVRNKKRQLEEDLKDLGVNVNLTETPKNKLQIITRNMQLKHLPK